MPTPIKLFEFVKISIIVCTVFVVNRPSQTTLPQGTPAQCWNTAWRRRTRTSLMNKNDVIFTSSATCFLLSDSQGSYATWKIWNSLNFWIFFQGLGFLQKPGFFYRNLEKFSSFESAVHPV